MKKLQDQAALLRKARKTLGKTNAELAADLGVSEPALIAWLAPLGAKKRRSMRKGSRLLLERILAEHQAKAK